MHVDILKIAKQESFAIFILCTTIFLFSASLKYVALPNILDYLNNKQLTSSFKVRISSEDGIASLKSDILKVNEQLEKRITGPDSASRELSGILDMLIKKAKASEIKFVKIQPLQETTQGDFILYPVILEMNAPFNALGRFVASLESTPDKVKLDKISIDNGNDERVSAKIQVTCFLQTKENKK